MAQEQTAGGSSSQAAGRGGRGAVTKRGGRGMTVISRPVQKETTAAPAVAKRPGASAGGAELLRLPGNNKKKKAEINIPPGPKKAVKTTAGVDISSQVTVATIPEPLAVEACTTTASEAEVAATVNVGGSGTSLPATTEVVPHVGEDDGATTEYIMAPRLAEEGITIRQSAPEAANTATPISADGGGEEYNPAAADPEQVRRLAQEKSLKAPVSEEQTGPASQEGRQPAVGQFQVMTLQNDAGLTLVSGLSDGV